MSSGYYYNKHYKLWTHIESNVHIPQAFIDSMDNEELRDYIYQEIGESISDSMIESFRFVPGMMS